MVPCIATFWRDSRLKSVDIRCVARLIALPCFALSAMWLALPTRAQTYQNVTNQKFRTVANGPQSALIVDVPNANDQSAVRQAAMNQYRASLATQNLAIKAQVAQMRARHLIRPNQQFDFTQAAIVRSNGRLAVQPARHTRGGGPPAANDITFNFPVSGTGAWSASTATALNNLANNVLKPELKALLGPPLWTDTPTSTMATVTVLNLDPRLGLGDEVIGALMVVNAVNGNPVVEIEFPTFSDSQTQFLAMAQSMAQAWHGPYRIGYDSWEQGMARAATVVAAKDIINAPDGTPLDPTNGFYYTPYYDLLNQPALGNNTFTPPTQANAPFSPTTLSGMLIPRLQMASMAWLKCYIENHSFFAQFNAAYYAVDPANVSTANDINALRALVKGVLPTVEAQAFDLWYEQQFVLDTSVTPGPKLYADVSPTFPTDGTTSDGGAAVFLIYYNTTLQGDETNLNGTVYPIYWDYNFANSLNLGDFSLPITIANGFGSVAPYFTNIGGNPPDQMRVAMDFPVNREYARVYFPTGQTGTADSPERLLRRHRRRGQREPLAPVRRCGHKDVFDRAGRVRRHRRSYQQLQQRRVHDHADRRINLDVSAQYPAPNRGGLTDLQVRRSGAGRHPRSPYVSERSADDLLPDQTVEWRHGDGPRSLSDNPPPRAVPRGSDDGEQISVLSVLTDLSAGLWALEQPQPQLERRHHR